MAGTGLNLWQKYGTAEDYVAAAHLHLNVTDWWFGTDGAEMVLVGTGGSMDPVIFAYGGNDVLLGNYQEDCFHGGEGDDLPERAWLGVLAELEAREMDVVVIPAEPGGARFHARPLYEEDFVIGVRAGHPFAAKPTLAQFCALRHVVVSLTGDPTGFVDSALTERGMARRVARTVPNFAMALAVVADGELAAALPRRFLAMHGRRFGAAAVEAPLPLPFFRLNAVVPKAALMDDGVAWLLDRLCETSRPPG